MNTKSQNSAWTDPDDAPELTEADLAHGTWRIDGRKVSRAAATAEIAKRRGRPPGSNKQSTTIRFDNDVLAAFRATGNGWQSRMNTALRDWLKAHPH